MHNNIHRYLRLLLLTCVLASGFPIASSEETSSTCSYNCNVMEEAHENENEPVAISLYIDNDFLTGNSKDGDYTGGFALAFSGFNATRHPFSIDQGLSLVNNSLGVSSLFEQSDHTLHSCEVGLALFTPTDIESKNPIQDDRPYSSLIYISNAQQNLILQDRASWISTFSIGVLGLSAAGSVQNAFHSAIGSDKAEGWENQISEGGELTLKYSLTRQKYHDTDSDNFQFTTAAGFSVGYITEAFYGASFRIGAIRTPWWNFNVYTSNYGEKSNLTLPTRKFLNEFYFIAGANVKVRAYNTFLQGQFRESAVTYSANEIEPIVYEGWLGLSYEFASRIRLNYIVRYQSSEVNVGQANREFTYGELVTSYKF